MEKRAKPNRRQIGPQKVESSEMRGRGCRKERERTEKCRKERKRERDLEGKRKEKRGRVKRSWSGYETNSDLIWHVYDSVFSFFFFQALRCRLELDWAVA